MNRGRYLKSDFILAVQKKSKISNIISGITNTICKISKPIKENHNIADIQILICNIAKKGEDLKHNHEDI